MHSDRPRRPSCVPSWFPVHQSTGGIPPGQGESVMHAHSGASVCARSALHRCTEVVRRWQIMMLLAKPMACRGSRVSRRDHHSLHHSVRSAQIERCCIMLVLLFNAGSVVRAPPTRPSLVGSREIDGVFPQVGSGAPELSDEQVAGALSKAMEVADLDGSGGLSWTEVQPVFARIRVTGDPTWTRLDQSKFYRIFGDKQRENKDASFQSVYNTIMASNLELDWRAATPQALPERRNRSRNKLSAPAPPDRSLDSDADAEAKGRNQYYESIHKWRLNKHAQVTSNGEVEAHLMAEEP